MASILPTGVENTLHEQSSMPPDALFENSGVNGTKSCIIVVGRVHISRSPLLAEYGDESTYPSRSQRTKVHVLDE